MFTDATEISTHLQVKPIININKPSPIPLQVVFHRLWPLLEAIEGLPGLPPWVRVEAQCYYVSKTQKKLMSATWIVKPPEILRKYSSDLMWANRNGWTMMHVFSEISKILSKRLCIMREMFVSWSSKMPLMVVAAAYQKLVEAASNKFRLRMLSVMWSVSVDQFLFSKYEVPKLIPLPGDAGDSAAKICPKE